MGKINSVYGESIGKNLGAFKIPLYIGWTLTYRCNQKKCLYCMVWKKKSLELETRQIFKIIGELALLGTKVICFSGGEALVRDDIGKIVDFTRRKGINADLNSNGFLVEEKKSQLKGVRILTLSLDGPEKIHDRLRGKGSYRRVLGALDAARKNKTQVYFRAVLSKVNAGYIGALLDIAREHKVEVVFQPSMPKIYGLDAVNPVAPSGRVYQKMICELIARKNSGEGQIFNSLPMLEYFRKWPRPPKICCASGKIMFGIKPDGMLYPCTWGRDPAEMQGCDCLSLGVREAIRRLPVACCSGCGNASSLEFNYRLSLLLGENRKFSLKQDGSKNKILAAPELSCIG